MSNENNKESKLSDELQEALQSTFEDIKSGFTCPTCNSDLVARFGVNDNTKFFISSYDTNQSNASGTSGIVVDLYCCGACGAFIIKNPIIGKKPLT